VELLSQLNHPNIVKYVGTLRESRRLNIFLEYVPGGSISELLTRFGPLAESVIRVYTRQILKGKRCPRFPREFFLLR
jgi:serine/threonine protein kinase